MKDDTYPDPHGTPEYEAGRAAFIAGVKDCKLAKGARFNWWVGWLDARTDKTLGRMFRKRGVA